MGSGGHSSWLCGIVFFFFFFGHAMWLEGSQFPDQGTNPGPWQWKHKVPATGLPENSPIIITLNVSGLNAPIKRHGEAKWIKNQDLSTCCLQETHFRPKTDRLKVRGWERVYHANENEKKAGAPIFISHQVDFKTKAVERDKKGHYIMIKGSIQKDIYIYTANTEAPKYIRQILTNKRRNWW